MVSHADDGSIMATGNNIDIMCTFLNRYLEAISSFFTACSLQISTAKSTAILFSSWTNEIKLLSVNHPKILGVTFGSLLFFSLHTTISYEAETRSSSPRQQHLGKR